MLTLRTRARDLHQDSGSVTTYFTTLKKIWQEMDLFTQLTWKDPSDATVLKKILARERTYDFLVGLHPSLDEVWGASNSFRPWMKYLQRFVERKAENRLCSGLCLYHNHLLKLLPWLLVTLAPNLAAICNGAIISNVPTTPKRYAGKSMESLLIGFQKISDTRIPKSS